jgi:Tfp pilus assembly protein PilF/2-polyprenyl-3-methyl-5-hydroxy-6-metoxy-1,4-benzoquinol methylase
MRARIGEGETTQSNQTEGKIGAGSQGARNTAIALVNEGNALEEQGLISEAMAQYDAAVRADPQYARAHLNRGNILSGGQRDDARRAYHLALTCDPHYAAAHFNLGNLSYCSGDFEQALHNYQAAIAIKPDFADAFLALGNAFDTLGRTTEAAESFKRATEVKPDLARAHHDLGIMLSRLERLNEAENSLRRALSIEPESAEILHDLATVLLTLGKSPEAVQLIVGALHGASPSWSTKVAFVACVARTRFATEDLAIRRALTAAITEPWGMPHELGQPALSLVMLDERIARCVRVANERWPAKLSKAALFPPGGLVALTQDSLLHALLESAPVSSIEFERFLTCARRTILETALSEQGPDAADVAALQFYVALIHQCYVNEYIFARDDNELSAAVAAQGQLLALLDSKAAVPPFLLLAVAAYFPLSAVRDATRLFFATERGPLDEILRQQISEPLEERALRASVKRLTSITRGVSEEVRDQYEQNPYPRWVKAPMREQSRPFNEELRRALPLAPFSPMPDDRAPEILVAGCGTGAHSIFVAQRFRGAQVLAIDLSLSSISYAKRKTQELGVKNIEYAQADILRLGDVTRTFDIIESRGVLHHLADPFAGWRILLSRLRPGGFMGLGFYSELARRPVVKAREFIAARGYANSPDDIRQFRQDLMAENIGVELQWLSKMTDFYSTSDCRDLFFHTQEHRLTLRQIGSFLSEFALQFVGFELDPRILHRYRLRFPDDAEAINLRNWERFEAAHPDTFVGMYQFWIQRPFVDRRADDAK